MRWFDYTLSFLFLKVHRRPVQELGDEGVMGVNPEASIAWEAPMLQMPCISLFL